MLRFPHWSRCPRPCRAARWCLRAGRQREQCHLPLVVLVRNSELHVTLGTSLSAPTACLWAPCSRARKRDPLPRRDSAAYCRTRRFCVVRPCRACYLDRSKLSVCCIDHEDTPFGSPPARYELPLQPSDFHRSPSAEVSHVRIVLRGTPLDRVLSISAFCVRKSQTS